VDVFARLSKSEEEMLLQMNPLPVVDNPRNYAPEIVKELEQALLAGGRAVPDPKRKGFYDLHNDERTFFIQVSPITGRVLLLATWRRPEEGVELAGCSASGEKNAA
jgi:hypothetical protein